MGCFKRKSQGIFTESKDRKDIPQGLWYKCPECKNLIPNEEHKNNYNEKIIIFPSLFCFNSCE